MPSLFHLAYHVTDLDEARRFYGGVLGCKEGRSTATWVDFDFFGHQIVAHLSPDEVGHKAHNDVDGDSVPVRHFGAILSMKDWQTLADRLTERNTSFIIEPGIRFQGLPGEQATFFFLDPSGNALEFKAFHDDQAVFAR